MAFAAALWLMFLFGMPPVQAQGSSSAVQKGKQHAYTVLFYNVENLFDTLDAPDKEDADYLPGSDLHWNTDRYNRKLDSLAKVIRAAAGGSAPDLIGLAEIENAAVVEDLGRRVADPGRPYAVAWYDSPDMRGIDCALLYRKDKKGFDLRESRAIPLHFPLDSGYTSRDILMVSGRFPGMKNDLYLLVNHWPSRRGGLEESEPRRLVAARTLRRMVDSLLQRNPDAYLLAMGDFNDEPDNNSLSRVVCGNEPDWGLPGSTPAGSGLINLMNTLNDQGAGTYNYRGEWNMLDQFLVSPSLQLEDAPRKSWQVTGAAPFRTDWMMYNDTKFGPTPSRTYGGPNYYGGFSDHLPIRLTLYQLRGK